MNNHFHPKQKVEHDESEDRQACVICLEDLFSGSSRQKSIGAVVSCGHCLHERCFRKWQSSSEKTSKCPVCNGPVQSFVKLFLDDGRKVERKGVKNGGVRHNFQDSKDSINNANTSMKATQNVSSETPTTAATRSSEDAGVESVADGLLSRLKQKLRHYKRRNKSLQYELQTERHETQEMLLSTFHILQNILDQHDNERQRWSQMTLDLQQKLAATQEKYSQEKQSWQQQQTMMHSEFELVRHDCQRAEERVKIATESLTQVKAQQANRQYKLQDILNDKARLIEENRKLQKALSKYCTC